MKAIIFCALLALATCEKSYTIENDQSFKDVVKCIINKKPCLNDETKFKDAFITLLQEACEECNVEMIYLMKSFVNSFKRNAPKDYETFKNMYDPQNQYLKLFEDEIK